MSPVVEISWVLVLHQMVPDLLVFPPLLHVVRCVFFSIRLRYLAFGQRHVVVYGYALRLKRFGHRVEARCATGGLVVKAT